MHQVDMEEKDGQYGTYYSHTIQDVGYCNGKKITPFKGTPAPTRPTSPPAQTSVATSDWSDQEKSKQITRLTLAKTYIQQAVDFDNAVANADLEKWVDWIFTGKVGDTAKKLKPNKEQEEIFEAFDKRED